MRGIPRQFDPGETRLTDPIENRLASPSLGEEQELVLVEWRQSLGKPEHLPLWSPDEGRRSERQR